MGDSSGLERSFKRASNSARGFDHNLGRSTRGAIAGSGAFRGLGRSIAFASGGFLAGFGATSALRAAFEEFSQSQKVAAQTGAVLKSTGGIAGVSAKQVERLAKSIEHMTAFDDEAVKAGENVLLSFTRIRNGATAQSKIFDRTTKAVIDYAARMQVDVPQAAKLFGRALNDPIKGMSRLARVGIDFTDAEKKRVTQLEHSGRIEEAQAIILSKLEQRYKGAAVAAGDTFGGQVSKLRNSLLDMAGTIVGMVAPSLEKWLTKINAWLSKGENQKRIIDAVSSAGRTLKSVMDTIVAVGTPLVQMADKVAKAFGGWKHVIELLVGLKVALWISGVARSLGGVGAHADTSRAKVGRLRSSLTKLNGLVVTATIAVAIDEFIRKHVGEGKTVHEAGFDKRFGKWMSTKVTGHLGPLDPFAGARGKGVKGGAHSGLHNSPKDPLTTAGISGGRRNSFFPAWNTAAGRAVMGPGGGDTNISGPIHVYGVQDPDAFLRELQKIAARRAGSRSGRYAGAGLGLG